MEAQAQDGMEFTDRHADTESLKRTAHSCSKSASAVLASSAAAFQMQEDICSLWAASIPANRASPACQGSTPRLALFTPWLSWT